jgi:hypothetical protein
VEAVNAEDSDKINALCEDFMNTLSAAEGRLSTVVLSRYIDSHSFPVMNMTSSACYVTLGRVLATIGVVEK